MGHFLPKIFDSSFPLWIAQGYCCYWNAALSGKGALTIQLLPIRKCLPGPAGSFGYTWLLENQEGCCAAWTNLNLKKKKGGNIFKIKERLYFHQTILDFLKEALLYFVAILQVWNRIRFNTEGRWSLQRECSHYASVYHKLYIVK